MNLIDFIGRNQSQLHQLCDLIPVPIFYKDREGVYLGCNSAFEAFIRISREDLLGKSVFDLSPPDEAEVFFAKDKELFDNPGVQVYETKVSNTDGEAHTVRFHKTTFYDEDGGVAGLLGVILDITDHVQLQEKLDHLSRIDELTGVPNRRDGLDQLAWSLEADLRAGRYFSVLMMDIDHFKMANDTWGHSFGDRVLQEACRQVSSLLREQDYLFRYGGEEFVIYCQNTRPEDALKIAERIRHQLEQVEYFTRSNQLHRITVSIGVASGPDDGTTAQQLLSAADRAMYLAKESGRNCVKAVSET